MKKDQLNSGSLQPDELNAVYAISRVVAEKLEIDKTLSEILRLARPVFIFDNAVLYLENNKSKILEPAFARAIGRGKSSEADISWGNKAASKTFSSGKIYLSEAKPNPKIDRLEQAYYLGQPMVVSGEIIGALVFIRFGGPNFSDDHINLAEFIATHVTQLLEHQRLVTKVGKLEAEHKLVKLQSDFLATVSHELKTPLGFIKGFATTLLREDAQWKPNEKKEFLEIIDDEADNMGELINNLLDSSRLQSGTLTMEFEDFDIHLALIELVDRLKISNPKLSITIDAHEPEYILFGDPNRLTQVINNILGNAIKYAPGSPIEITMIDHLDTLNIKIQDFGAGISKEHLPHIFKRFYRIPDEHRSIRGSGLGLYICDQIIRAHSGKIHYQSKLGKGTSFEIEIPKAALGVAA